MKQSVSRHTSLLILGLAPALIYAQHLTPLSSPGAPPTKIYRQVLPNGQISYSDQVVQGSRVDATISIDPAIKGNIWSTASSNRRPVIEPQFLPTPVLNVSPLNLPGRQKTLAEANKAVYQAEKLLEKAKQRQQSGQEPLPGEFHNVKNNVPRLNHAYYERQRLLGREVADAELLLQRSHTERDMLIGTR